MCVAELLEWSSESGQREQSQLWPETAGARSCLLLLHASSVYLEILFSCSWQQNIRGKRREKERERGQERDRETCIEWMVLKLKGSTDPSLPQGSAATASISVKSSGYRISRKFHCHHHPQRRKDSTRFPCISFSSFQPTNPNTVFMSFPP